MLEYLRKEYNYFYGYSKTLGEKCYANHCQSCNALQGNFFLFDEVDSPFWIDSPEVAKMLKLYKVNLPYDIATISDPAYSTGDMFIDEYGQKFEIESVIA